MFGWCRKKRVWFAEEIDAARINIEEQKDRRISLIMELSSKDAQDCMSRVRSRMRDGDKNFIPPMFNREEAYQKWCAKHRVVAYVVPFRKDA